MKKVALFAVAVALAGITQAASIAWGTGGAQNIKTFDGSANILLGAGVVQLIYVGNSVAGPTGIYGTEVIVDSGLVGDGATAPKGGKYVDTFTYAYGVDQAGTGQALDLGDQFIIRVYDAATVGGAAHYWNSGVYAIAATDNSVNDNFVLPLTTGSGTWYPVPEPTSFALLGLGAATLALRRRLRK